VKKDSKGQNKVGQDGKIPFYFFLYVFVSWLWLHCTMFPQAMFLALTLAHLFFPLFPSLSLVSVAHCAARIKKVRLNPLTPRLFVLGEKSFLVPAKTRIGKHG